MGENGQDLVGRTDERERREGGCSREDVEGI
jgi:hypothetical protein